MQLAAQMAAPHFSRSERDEIERTTRVLERHPYLRANLEPRSAAGFALQEVLSVRLALLHTEGVSGADHRDARLANKLRDWETALLEALDGESDEEDVRLRYDTTTLLHPQAEADGRAPATERARMTSAWESRRAAAPVGELLTQKLQQNVDFFRHGSMLPLYWGRRRRIRKLVPARVRGHQALRETFFAIEQVGPIVDNFAFRGRGGVPWSTRVGLADIAFLYMQLADEFLDELAAATGSFEAAGRIVRSRYRSDTRERPLLELSLRDLRDADVDPEAHVTKFGMTLGELFTVLEEVAASIDVQLASAADEVQHAAHLFLHHCFQTYLDEAELCERAPERRADRLPLERTAWHFYRKNNLVMMLWLDLRARLLGLDPSVHCDAIRSWGYLLAAFQIFDDLKDIALDLGKQPNYPLQIATHDYPSEREWIDRRFRAHRGPVTREEVPEVNLQASRTVRQCMDWSRLIALAHFDNAMLYAWDQRWQKSWLRRRGSFNPETVPRTAKRTHAVDRLVRALLALRGPDASNPVDDAELSFALDTAAYEGSWQIYLALFPNARAMYRFATLRMFMTTSEKARAARRLLRRFPRARSSALLGLAEGDVDHQIPSDRLEAFAELIEI
jgi:hypothetical protein